MLENTVGKGEIARYEQFSFSLSVFKRLTLQTRKNQGLFGKGLKKKKMANRGHSYFTNISCIIFFSVQQNTEENRRSEDAKSGIGNFYKWSYNTGTKDKGKKLLSFDPLD